MKQVVLLIFILCAFIKDSVAQENARGGVVKNQTTTVGQTRAVVVGISSYPRLSKEKQLVYADKDAELFNEYLLVSKLVSESKLIINKEASASNVLLQIDAVLRKSVPNDKVIIYFAGHGDVAKDQTKNQDDAYLLCNLASTNADYSITDAISLSVLQQIIAESAKKGISVTLITDACHSGKVASSEAAANSVATLLIKEWDRVVKLASCQSNELSYEDVKWGNGHGVFTYYLVKGLSYEADKSPADSLISLRELGLYLDQMVPEATNFTQNPIKIGGDARSVFAKVIPNYFFNSKDQLPQLKTMLAARSVNESTEFKTDESIKLYADFKKHLKNGKIADSAFSDYQAIVLIKNDEQTELVKNELILSSLSEAQKVLDKYLEGGNDMPSDQAFQNASNLFALAIKLYAKKNALSKQWESKKLFLQAYVYIIQRRYEKYNEAKALLNKAQKNNKKSAYINQAFGRLYNELEDYRRSEKYLLKAIALAPRWTYPKSDLGNTYFDMGNWKAARKQFDDALKLDANLARIYNNTARISMDQGRLAESERLFLKADSIVPNTAIYTSNLGLVFLRQGRINEAEKMLTKSLYLDSNFFDAYKHLGEYYLNENKDLEQAEKALVFFNKAKAIQPYYYLNYNNLGDYYYKFSNENHAVKKADSLYRMAISLNPDNHYGYYSIALLKLKAKDTITANKLIAKMMQGNKKNAKANYFFAAYQESINKNKIAAESYRQAIKLDPYYRLSYYALASLLEKDRQLEEAAHVLLKVPLIFPNSPEDVYKIGNFYLRRGKYVEAIRYFELALKYDPSYAYAWSALAYAKLDFTHEINSAKYAFQQAEKLNPFQHNPKVFAKLIFNKSRALPIDSVGYQQLIAYYLIAYSLDSTNADYTISLARTYYLNNELSKATSYLQLLQTNKSLIIKKSFQNLSWKILLQKNQLVQAKQLIDEEFEDDKFPSYLGKALYFYLKGDLVQAKANVLLEQKESKTLLQAAYLKKNYNEYLLNIIHKLVKL
ncbi:tetratricopeptide repeat protein [Pedobacter sp. MW01-1-1]|uniref:tetratricopeptide repeat protein n=1 Tax=Pedobacter sp. MW01-1-1 TaxID=3383027 RepID=UPI003FEFB8AE